MKFSLKLLLACSLASTLLLADNKQATKNTAAAKKQSNMNLAYVNTHEIITLDPNLLSSASDEWRDNYNGLKKTIEPLEKEIQDLSMQFETLQKSGIADQQTLKEKAEDLQKRYQSLNQLVQQRLTNAQTQLQTKVKKAIQEITKENNYSLVFDGAAVLDAGNAENATSKVLDKINREYAIEKAKKINSEKLTESNLLSTQS